MQFLSRLFARPKSAAQHSKPQSQITSGQSQHSKSAPVSRNATRRELLRVVLRDTLQRNGIPVSWVTAEMLHATSREREAGIHWRLAIRHWDARLPGHMVALQNSLINRLHGFDPLAEEWLMGISWRFALDDESMCPAMPHPGSWTAEPHEPPAAASVPRTGGSGDVIAGPVRVGSARSDPKADLQRLLEAGQAMRRKGGAAHEATQPMDLRAEPAKLRGR